MSAASDRLSGGDRGITREQHRLDSTSQGETREVCEHVLDLRMLRIGWRAVVERQISTFILCIGTTVHDSTEP